MSVFGDRLRGLREDYNISQAVLAKALKISRSSVHMYECGEREPSYGMLASISDYFGVDLDYLLGRSPYKNKEDWARAAKAKLPLLGDISCGSPIFAQEEYESFVDSGGMSADFCLRARGDSMIGARIMDGDLVFIRRQETVENGAIAAVIIDDSATLKRFYYYPETETLSLLAENPAYPPQIYQGEELEHIHILGQAIGFRSELK